MVAAGVLGGMAILDARAQLHPRLELPPVLLAISVRSFVDLASLGMHALGGLRVDPVEVDGAVPGRGRLGHHPPRGTATRLVPSAAAIVRASCAQGQQYRRHRKYYADALPSRLQVTHASANERRFWRRAWRIRAAKGKKGD